MRGGRPRTSPSPASPSPPGDGHANQGDHVPALACIPGCARPHSARAPAQIQARSLARSHPRRADGTRENAVPPAGTGSMPPTGFLTRGQNRPQPPPSTKQAATAPGALPLLARKPPPTTPIATPSRSARTTSGRAPIAKRRSLHVSACRINASASHTARFDVLGFIGRCFGAAVTSADSGYIGLAERSISRCGTYQGFRTPDIGLRIILAESA